MVDGGSRGMQEMLNTVAAAEKCLFVGMAYNCCSTVTCSEVLVGLKCLSALGLGPT